MNLKKHRFALKKFSCWLAPVRASDRSLRAVVSKLKESLTGERKFEDVVNPQHFAAHSDFMIGQKATSKI
jgi:hypothetical protein